MKLKYIPKDFFNFAIENINFVTGAKIKKFFRSYNFNIGQTNFSICKQNECTNRYFGIINGKIEYGTKSYFLEQNIDIISIEEAYERRNELLKKFKTITINTLLI